MPSKTYYEINFDEMLKFHSCTVLYKSNGENQIDKYALEKGCYKSKYSTGEVIERNMLFPNKDWSERYFDKYGNSKLIMNWKIIHYITYLRCCRELFQIEIKNNILSMPDPKYIPVYLNNIYEKYKSKNRDFENEFDIRLNAISRKVAKYEFDRLDEAYEVSYNNYEQTFLFLSNLKHEYPIYLKQKPEIKLNKSKNKALLEIWKPDNNGSYKPYHKTIEILIESKYITRLNDGRMKWNKYPSSRGWVSHIAGFLSKLIQLGWIDGDYSSSELQNIIYNTFEINTFNPKPFKSLNANNIDK